MAFYPTLEGPALDAYRRMVSDLKAKAMKELGLREDELVVRQLRPADLGADTSTPDYFIGLTALTWTNIVNAQTVADNRFVGINGFYICNTGTIGVNNENVLNVSYPPQVATVQQIRITRKGSVARYYEVTPIPHFVNKTGYTDEPITVDQNTTITIEGLARTAGSLYGGKFNILGAVVEKKGLLINP